MPSPDRQVGTRYRVLLSDCCIQGEFEAVLVDVVFNEATVERGVLYDPMPTWDTLVFDNGVTLTHVEGVALEEINA